MSTLDVTCGRCEKKFRVRAEFAGKSTRCPGCSAPITIGSAGRPAPPVARAAEPPPPRPRRRDDEDNEPRRPAADWTSVEMAFRREQVAVLFVFVGILSDYFAYCLGQSMEQGTHMDGTVMALLLLFVVGPSLAAAAFGIMARLSALRTPPESRAKPSAVASLLCGLAGLGCLVIMAFAFMLSLDSQRTSEILPTVAAGGLILSTLGAIATFLGFVAQVGIARRSAAVSRGIGRTSVAVAVCSLSLIGIATLYALMSELTTPASRFGAPSYPQHDGFYKVTVLFLFPLALGVVLVLYHRLLAAGRQAIRGEAAGRYDG